MNLARWSPLVLLVSGCGSGTALLSNSDDDDDSPAAMSAFQVLDTRQAPARLSFVLTDPEADSVEVTLLALVDGNEEPLTQLPGVAGNPVRLETSRDGELHELAWDFSAEAFLEDEGLQSGVTVFARLGSSTAAPREGITGMTVDLGNDPPEILSIDRIEIDPVDQQAVGTTGIEFTVADSSEDVVSIAIHFEAGPGPFEEGPSLSGPARPALLDPGVPTPEFALRDVRVSREGTRLVFFWDTDFDLTDADLNATLTLTAHDGTAGADPLQTELFRVDNNEEPIIQFDAGALVLNPDEHGGIAVPFTLIDEESDPAQVIFQWRRPNETFPWLPSNPFDLGAILDSFFLRRLFQVCSPLPRLAAGELIPIDAEQVRLPDLATNAVWAQGVGLAGHEIEIFRSRGAPRSVVPAWTSTALDTPVAAVPLGDGREAFVLDQEGGEVRLRGIELATGNVLHGPFTLGPGVPRAMSVVPLSEFFLDPLLVVVVENAGTWSLLEFEFELGIPNFGRVVRTFSPTEPDSDPVRSLASLGLGLSVLVVGEDVLVVDSRISSLDRVSTLMEGLAAPRGLAADPTNPRRFYLAERDAPGAGGTGRILAVELDQGDGLPVVVKSQGLARLDSPEALAIARDGTRLLVTAAAPGGGRRLFGLDLGSRGEHVPFELAERGDLDGASLAAGPDDLALLAFPERNDILVDGGLEQRRRIDAFEPTTQVATLATDLAPVPSPDQTWRIDAARRSGTPEGARGVFTWDSRDVRTGPVLLRAAARDAEVGVFAETAASKDVRLPQEVEPLVLGGAGTTDAPRSIAVADLDTDGDLDVATLNLATLTVFHQTAPGEFAAVPLLLTDGPTLGTSLAAADLDSDGDQDLLAFAPDAPRIYFQQADGTFQSAPLLLAATPSAMATADLDGDGDVDLVAALALEDQLVAFLQTAPGTFETTPRVLATVEPGRHPDSVDAGDLDGDGDVDLAAASRVSNKGWSFLQNQDGSFTAQFEELNFQNPAVASLLPATDDAFNDLVYAFGGSVLTLGQFSFPAQGPFATGDFDGDRLTDFVSTRSGGLGFHFLDPNVFPGGVRTLDVTVPADLGAIATADLEGDGDVDIVAASETEDRLLVFLAAGPVELDPPPLQMEAPSMISDLAALDVGLEGLLEILANCPERSIVQEYTHTTPGNFNRRSPSLFTSHHDRMRAADMDGDGDSDLVLIDSGFSVIAAIFYLSPITTPMGRDIHITGVSMPNSDHQLLDADDDGDLDLVVAMRGSENGLRVVFQDPEVFSRSIRLESPSADGPRSIAVADVDGDGLADLVSANEISDNLTIFRRTGPGTFEAAPRVLDTGGLTDPRTVLAADLDDDGRVDLVTTNDTSGQDDLTYFFQELSGAFTVAVLAPAPALLDGPDALAACDLDLDGDLDLVTGNRGSALSGAGSLSVILQEAPRRFGRTPDVLALASAPGRTPPLLALDLDGDGTPDLAAADDADLLVFWGGR